MSSTTHLPGGSKLRTQTSRRYVVAVEYVPGKPVILYRTDVLDRAVKRKARTHGALVVDTVTRRVVA